MDAMWFGMLGNGVSMVREDGLYISADDGEIDENGLPFANPWPSALAARDLAETIPLSTAPTSFANGAQGRIPLGLIFHVAFPVPHAQGLLPRAIEYDPRPGGYGTTQRGPTASLPNALVLTNHFIRSGVTGSGSSVSRFNTLTTGLTNYANQNTKIGFAQAQSLMNSVAVSTTRYSAVAWPGDRKLMVAITPAANVPATQGTYITANWTEVFAATAPPPSGVTITQQPTDRTVTVGQTANFTVTATGTGLTYQWQRNGANIAGATSASYTSAATILDDNGATFRCVVSSSGGGQQTSSSATLVVNSTATTPTGLRGQYYLDTNFTSLYTTQTDPTVNFTWSTQGDNFSIRWTGQVQPQYAESYTFYTNSDGGVRVWLNNQLIIDHYTIHNSVVNRTSAPITLVAGRRYNIRVDYYDTVDTSVIQLGWQSQSQAQGIIPQSRLYTP